MASHSSVTHRVAVIRRGGLLEVRIKNRRTFAGGVTPDNGGSRKTKEDVVAAWG